MHIFLLILFGFLAGIIGGMGMGGGTLLVPLLSFLDLSQKNIQAVNLISFLPMSVAALIMHSKNKLVEKRGTLWLIIPAVAAAVGGALLTASATDRVLQICFAVFLILVGGWQFFVAVKAIVNGKKKYVENGQIGKMLNKNQPADFLDRS
jgi:uncharacterized membrane protein YfcA